jgi:hypothetical protein
VRLALLILVASAAAALAPSEGRGEAVPGGGVVADTIVRGVRFTGPPPRSVRLGLAPIPLPWTIALPAVPGALDPWLDPAGVSRSGAEVLARRADWGATLPPAARAPRPAPTPGALTPATPEVGRIAELTALATGSTDLGVRVVGRTELGGDWSRFRPCEQRLRASCDPTLVPRLEPELRFGIQVGGTIADRLQVDVDYDQLREFEAANTINIRYLGGEDAIVRRLEIGDVTFRLPPSRFLTQGLPAGNFGFQAEGQLGPLDFQAVWAEQKGDLSTREFRLTGVGSERSFVQQDTLVLDDADYARGQFFFLLDPRELADYPHLDVLALDASVANPFSAPGPEPIQLYRFENDPVLRKQVEGFIQADALAGLGADTVRESGWFRYLQPGLDYFVHPSALWVALRNPLAPGEMLAVTYVTAAGDTVGTYNPESVYVQGGRPRLRLLRASPAFHQPGRPTWELEMHNVYRVSGSSDVDPASVDLTISLGEPSSGRIFKHAPTGDDLSFLRLFGLDEESPLDRVDGARVYRPAGEAELFQDQPPVQGTFIVFPTLHPFREPPPLPSLRLSAAETQAILGPDANQRIYDAADPFERDNGGLFRLTIPYRVRSEGLISAFSLGALGIRDGSERIFLGDRLLVRGVDYLIDYDVGQVSLRDAETLFAAEPEGVVRASWEQKQIFRTAPTSVAGFRATYGLGERGSLDLLGLYRSEQTLVNRPQLGVEPGAVALGGVNGRYRLEAGWLDRWLGDVPLLRAGGGSGLSIAGEVAIAMPNQNLKGDVFLDDFDATAALPLALVASDWQLGSAPESTLGLESLLAAPPSNDNAAPLVWQHSWIVEGPAGDSAGVHEGFLPRTAIDRQIRLTGSEIREAGLRLTFGGNRAGGAVGTPFADSRWRSITTLLGPTGVDLTKTEFLEFYASGDEQLALVIDLGLASEDALFIDRAGSASGIKPNGDPWGLGRLDQEADPARGEIWSDATDRFGVWGEDCFGAPQAIYRVGDARANCTRGNGRNDSEDLDGNGNLELAERHFRYVVELGLRSRYLVRSPAETGTAFALYRVPIQDPNAHQIGGTLTEADLRAVKHLRMTVVGQRPGSITLARMSLIGSRWVKRAGEGVLLGMIGDELAGGVGRLEVASVSRVTEGETYQSPPNVLEQLADPTLAFGGIGVEFNEKSLGLRFEELGLGERAEAYQRFPQQPRDFLGYREARLWVVPRFGDWGPDRDRYFFLKVGTDAENFYLYRTRLNSPPGAAGVRPTDWLPEVVIQFDVWQELRRVAEEYLSRTPRAPWDPPVALWSADSTYAIVIRDRGRGPDLANVRELSVGVWNGGAPFGGEVWVDELRLGRAVRTGGAAAHVNMDLVASEVADVRLTLRGRGAHFRQLEEQATYLTDRVVTVASTVRLDRLTPAEWGIDLPLTVTHDRAALHPFYLPDSDVRADRIDGLRSSDSRQTRVGLGFRKRTPSSGLLARTLLDGLDARVGWYRSGNGTVTSDQSASGVDARFGYARTLGARDFALVPGFLEPVLRALLPAFLEAPFVDARLRWSPQRFAFGTSWARQDARLTRFEHIVVLPGDSFAVPTLMPREAMETAGELRLAPLPSLTADVTVVTGRDLLDPGQAVTDPLVQALLEAERGGVAGVDLGWETRRDVRTRVTYRPQLVSWLRHDVTWTTRYVSDRNASFVRRWESEGDTMAALQRSADGQRDLRLSVALDPGRLSEDLLGAGAEDVLALLLTRLRPLTVVRQDGVVARFHREPVDPGTRFQLGWGDVDEFREIDGDTAAYLTDRRTWTVGSGVAAGTFAADLGWSRTHAHTFDARSDRVLRVETWPDVRVSVSNLVGPWGVRGTVVTGLQRLERETAFGVGEHQLRSDEDVQVPAELTLTWARDATLSYRGTFRVGEGIDPTGNTERDRDSHRVSLASSVVAPRWLPLDIQRPLRVGIVWGYNGERDCRQVTGGPACVAFVDQLNQSLSVSLDTRVGGLEMGLDAAYVNRQSYVGQHTGSTQFQLGLYGQFLFEAGQLPVRAAP